MVRRRHFAYALIKSSMWLLGIFEPERIFAASTESARIQLILLFRLGKGLLQAEPQDQIAEHCAAHCYQFGSCFRDEIACINSSSECINGSRAKCTWGFCFWDPYRYFSVNLARGEAKPTTCPLGPCPSWLVKSAREGLTNWMMLSINHSPQEATEPAVLKEVIFRSLLKKLIS